MTFHSEAAEAYRNLFFASAPRHAIWSGQHWLPTAGRPSLERIDAALGEGPSLAAFFLDDDSRCSLLAVDVDAPDSWSEVILIARMLVAKGIVCYPEHSRRGGHIWVVLDRPIPAIVGRRALMVVIEAAGLDPADPKIELRPNVDRWTSDYAGGSLRGPWMRHPSSGERYGLLGALTGEPLPRKADGPLLAVEEAEVEAIAVLAERYVPRFVAPPARVPDVSRSGGSEVLVGLGADPARGHGVVRCPAHEDRHPSLSWRLTDTGRLLLRCHTGCSFADILAAARVTA